MPETELTPEQEIRRAKDSMLDARSKGQPETDFGKAVTEFNEGVEGLLSKGVDGQVLESITEEILFSPQVFLFTGKGEVPLPVGFTSA